MSGYDDASYTVRRNSFGIGQILPMDPSDSILIHTSSGFIRFQLPSALLNPGRMVTVIVGGAGSCVLTPSGLDTVNGQTNLDVLNGGRASVVSDGVSTWLSTHSSNTQID